MASRLQDVILRGLAADQPLSTDVAPGTLYYSTDTAVTERCADDGLSWEDYTDGGGGGGGVGGVTFQGPGCTFDGGGSALVAGSIRYVLVPYAHTITAAYLLADVSGSAVVDVWRLAFGAALPTVANTITAAAKPTLTAAITSVDTTLTGWSAVGAANDVYAFKLDSVSTITALQVQLVVTR